jgi:ankyrin repeat protein
MDSRDFPDSIEHLIDYYGGDLSDVMNLSCDDTGYTPLTYACYVGTAGTVNELDWGSPDYNLCDGKGRTALIAAAQNEKKERSLGVTKYLFNLKPSKANFNRWSMKRKQDDDGNTALIYAAELGNLEVVKVLIGEKAVPERRDCVNIVNKKGETALSMAAFNARHDVVKVLLSAGARVTGATGARTLLYSLYKGNAETTEALLDSRKDWGRAKEDEILLMMVTADEHGHLLIGKLMERASACAGGDI